MFLKEVKWIPFCVLLFDIFIGLVESQICTQLGLTSFWESNIISFSYVETYQGQCSRRIVCNKTRIALKTELKNHLVHRVGPMQICCKGYIRDELDDSSNIKCNAVCFPACKNGYCDSPGQCKCNDGYKLNFEETHNCLPICDSSCTHGTCTAPNNCSCSFGYELADGLCQPICDELCLNGICRAPGTCDCLNGYRKTENNTCMPYCSRGCDHGICSKPEKCTCHLGWQHNVDNDWQCVPEGGELATQNASLCSNDTGSPECKESGFFWTYGFIVILVVLCLAFVAAVIVSVRKIITMKDSVTKRYNSVTTRNASFTCSEDQLYHPNQTI